MGALQGSKAPGPGTYIQLQNMWQWLSEGGTVKQWIKKAYRPLPFHMCRDALSYGAFFGAYDCVVRYLTPSSALPKVLGNGGSAPGLTPGHLQTHTLPLMGRSVVAGAAAGTAFHMIAYPFQKAVGDPRSSTERLVWMRNAVFTGQFRSLYRGAAANSWPSIVMGALTFSVYDSVLRTMEAMDAYS